MSKEIYINSKVFNSGVWESKKIFVPIITIECETYLDKTMYEGPVATAKKIKIRMFLKRFQII